MRLALTLALAVAVTGPSWQRQPPETSDGLASSVARYKITPADSEVSFQIRHGIRQFVGHFSEFSGDISIDHSFIERSSVSFQVKTASIDTKSTQRDEHLRSPDFFDVAQFPQMGFRSTSMQRAGDDRYSVIGQFTLRGVTKPITLDVRTSRIAMRPTDVLRFSVTTSLNRRDYGMVWNRVLDRHGVLLGDDVRVAITLTARSFKGGTSLAKGWNLIERCSEDIDISRFSDPYRPLSGNLRLRLYR